MRRVPAALVYASLIFLGLAAANTAGRETPPAPRRIISTAPSITEILFALGAGDRVAAVTTFCRYPPEARMKPKIGGFATPNLELILALEPDLLVTVDRRAQLAGRLQGFPVPILDLGHADVEGVFISIQRVADRLGIAERGKELVARIRTDLEEARRVFRDRPRKRVLFLIGRSPGSLSDLHAVGKGGYIDELLSLAGGENIFGETATLYPKVSLEEILARDPEVIVDMGHRSDLEEGEIRAIQSLWRQFPRLQAVRQNGVFVVQEDLFVVPGPRVAEAVKALAGMIHGEARR